MGETEMPPRVGDIDNLSWTPRQCCITLSCLPFINVTNASADVCRLDALQQNVLRLQGDTEAANNPNGARIMCKACRIGAMVYTHA